jgi:ribosomal protein S18 acetylase RimI-like enzyme
MHPLDNVVWHALTTRQAHLSEGNGEARRFKPEISRLGAVLEPNDTGYDSLAELMNPGDTVNMAFNDPFQPRRGFGLVFGGPMLQMVYTGSNGAGVGADAANPEIVELGEKDAADMVELTELTKPGPFTKRTHELGTYLGIRQQGKLIAMAGERLKVPGFTEVSAVCTHPAHTGKGYARLLMMEVMRRIFDRGEAPFLHVRESNVRAIGIYERMGFVKRVLRQHVVLRREAA